LDPAVKRAVHSELGLVHDTRTAITTRLGDARNVVDDLIRSNQQEKAPVKYDFVYGDAFNDFSIPWHLTTLEFTRKVHSLMQGDGVYLINVIDIFPRTVFPAGRRGLGEATFNGQLPDVVKRHLQFNRWNPVAGFRHLQIKPTVPDEYLVRYEHVMSSRVQRKLNDQFAGYARFQSVVDDLFEQTRMRETFSGELPDELRASVGSAIDWAQCDVCESLEVLRVVSEGVDGFVLGFRGAMTEEIFEQLRRVAPRNRKYLRAIDSLYVRSREQLPGRFLGRYVQTVADVFANVYVFSSTKGIPHDDRDTFVIVCSDRPVNYEQMAAISEHWDDEPFARIERDGRRGSAIGGQMNTLLELGQGLRLTDDHAPVENLLAPIITRQDD
jgi:hypothetical protein